MQGANSLIDKSEVKTFAAWDSRSLATGSSWLGCMVKYPPAVPDSVAAAAHRRRAICDLDEGVGECLSPPAGCRPVSYRIGDRSDVDKVDICAPDVATFEQFFQRIRESVGKTPKVRDQVRAGDEANAQFTVERHDGDVESSTP